MPNADQKLLFIGKRKLQPMGNGGLVVNVPRIWAHFHQLQVGDKVEMGMDGDGELRVRPAQPPTPQEASRNEA
jgi:antitoxin component of MazEF toxin-antitoxin module